MAFWVLKWPTCTPPNKTKFKRKNEENKVRKIKRKEIKSFVMEPPIGPNKSCFYPLVHTSLLEVFSAKSHWSGSRPLSPLHVQFRAPTRTLPVHPTATLCCGLQVRSLYLLCQIIGEVDVGAGKIITLGLSLGSCMIGLSDGNWGQHYHVHNSRADSPHLC